MTMTNRAKRIIIASVLFLFCFAANGYTESSTSVGLKAGTLGAGLELEGAFSDSIGGRIGVNYFTYNYSATEDDIKYDFDLKLKSVSALLDWHPFQGIFKMSAGALLNGNKIDGKATSAATYTIGDVTFPGAAVGNLKTKVDFNDIAPYLGFGWDTTYGKKKGLGFLFEAGAIYQGSPKVKLSADGPISTQPAFLAELAKEEKNLQDDLDKYKIYPVVSLGLIYRF